MVIVASSVAASKLSALELEAKAFLGSGWWGDHSNNTFLNHYELCGIICNASGSIIEIDMSVRGEREDEDEDKDDVDHGRDEYEEMIGRDDFHENTINYENVDNVCDDVMNDHDDDAIEFQDDICDGLEKFSTFGRRRTAATISVFTGLCSLPLSFWRRLGRRFGLISWLYPVVDSLGMPSYGIWNLRLGCNQIEILGLGLEANEKLQGNWHVLGPYDNNYGQPATSEAPKTCSEWGKWRRT
ncbi:hypothetical protein CMV_019537 [Castanea mollissima]|uniref:Uncharacterized protein n=1 Tax=Castanea mollissima TaxID=60419 RepID=A0A8J4R060_9ROSI|nr:hypothetical protein CMV_019537 [Castanea mollissima]